MIRPLLAALSVALLPVAAPAAPAPSAALVAPWLAGLDLAVARHGKDDGVKHVRHGGDDGANHAKRRPRVPGGSGCDDPRDLIEHPECRR